jgi:HlyD family secretion protein
MSYPVSFFRHFGFAASVASALLLAGPSIVSAQPGGEPPPAPVTTAIVQSGAYAQAVRLSGTVEPYAQTRIRSEVTGTIAEFFVEEGDYVTTGGPLLQIRRLPLELEHRRRDADARMQQAKLDELKAGTRQEDVTIARAESEQAIATLEIAEKDFKRNEALLADKSVSQAEFDRVKQKYVEAKWRADSLAASYDRAKNGARAEEIEAQAAMADSMSAMASMAKDDLERAAVVAPYSGTITARHVGPYGWVDKGTDLLDLEFIDYVKVKVDVPEIYYTMLKVGQKIDVTFDAFPSETFQGSVFKIVARASEMNRSFPTRIVVENMDHRLAPGMLARVTLVPPPDGRDRSIVVPKDALVPQGPMMIVYRAKQVDGASIAEMVPVRPGRFFGEAVEVFGELSPGEQVVVRGNERLQPGQKLLLNQFITNADTAKAVNPDHFFREKR